MEGNIQISAFSLFLCTEMAQVLICPCGRQAPVYCTLSMSWLLMTWRHQEPGYQQEGYYEYYSIAHLGKVKYQSISRHDIGLVPVEYSKVGTTRLNDNPGHNELMNFNLYSEAQDWIN